MGNKPQYPELRDYLLKELGWYDEAQRVGYSHLPSRVVGMVGGLTNKLMVTLAQQEMK